MTIRDIKNLGSRYILYTCFFLLLQVICRFVFIYYKGLDEQLTESVFSSFYHGFSLDIAFTSYMLGLFLLMDIIFPFGWNIIRSTVFGILSFLLVFLAFADRYLFDIWGSKFNQDALHFMQHPKEAMASSSHLPVLAILLVCLLIGGIFGFSFFYFTRKIETNLKYQIKLIAVIVAGAFVFLGARQSLGVAPIGPSGAYYSKNPANNSASLNSGWNFIYQCFLPIDYLNLNDYNFFGAKDKDQLAKSYFVKSDSIPLKLEQKPNLVLIVLESFNAYLSQHYGGRMNHTPFFDSLSRSGISFTNCYSGTNRTDKALACINSGFPGTPWNSILNEPQKAVKLPQLSNLFKESGYTTSFSYGGDLSFANMRTYLDAGGFDDILDLDYFKSKSKIKTSKWGVHDEVVFAEHAARKKKEPFFDEILSLSSHEPFDVPYHTEQTNEEYGPFYNSVEYTDNCLKEYFNTVKKFDWFKNTVFVFVSDHGRDVGIDGNESKDSIRYKIPILLWGQPLGNKTMNMSHVSSQTDLPNTLAKLFNLVNDSTYFPFSRNIFVNEGAFFFTNGGWGILQEKGRLNSFENKYYQNSNQKSIHAPNASIDKGASIQYYLLNNYKEL